MNKKSFCLLFVPKSLSNKIGERDVEVHSWETQSLVYEKTLESGERKMVEETVVVVGVFQKLVTELIEA